MVNVISLIAMDDSAPTPIVYEPAPHADGAVPWATSWAEAAAAAGTLLAVLVALGLAVWELRRYRRERLEASREASLAAARQVFAWKQAETRFSDGEAIGGSVSYRVYNGSNSPIFDVTIKENDIQVADTAVIAPTRDPKVIRHEELRPGQLIYSNRLVDVTFTDIQGDRWRRHHMGRTEHIPVSHQEK